MRSRAERGNEVTYGPGFQPSFSSCFVSWGFAQGWYGTRRWRFGAFRTRETRPSRTNEPWIVRWARHSGRGNDEGGWERWERELLCRRGKIAAVAEAPSQ